MISLYSPADRGFDRRLDAIDRCQLGLLRDLAGQLGKRLVLKGGMAMRAAFGSVRLTKDIDFDRDGTISQETLKKNLGRLLVRAASGAGIREPMAEITKDSKTTVRARLSGTVGKGVDVRFDIEVSGREAPSPQNVREAIVVAPASYAIAPFPVTTYTNAALAAMKIGAALAAQRNAPRDLYDLRDLIRAGADPVTLLSGQAPDLLADFSANALSKLEMLSFQQAQQDLLPYLPPEERQRLDENTWIDMTLMVAQTIEAWCDAALEVQRKSVFKERP
jgi:predicted nucleotidyltransferase component of viral defense system